MECGDDDNNDDDDGSTTSLCLCPAALRVYMTSIPFINQREKQNTFPRLPTPMCGFNDDADANDDADDWGSWCCV